MTARASRIAAVAPALPEHRYAQAEITDALAGWVTAGGAQEAALRRFHSASQVEHRHLALPLERYAALGGFGPANDAFIEVGLDLAERAVRGALDGAGLVATDVDVVLVTSVTGVAAPSLDALLVGRLGLRPDVKRIPVFGLGCVAGAAGIARLHDYLLGHPRGVAVLVSVELCSLTVQADDASPANLVASGLFGDGAAAVLLVGAERARDHDGPDVLDSRSRLYPGTERVMGWDIGGTGFRIVLSADVAPLVEQHVGDDVRGFLDDHDLKVPDVARWVAHPGGPKVLEALATTLEIDDTELDRTWDSLRGVGNLSSSSVLHVLAEHLADAPVPGSHGVLLAMGPGFCSELVLLRWPER